MALCLASALATAQYRGSASRNAGIKPADGHTSFFTADEAAQALLRAAATDDTAALELLFGPSAREIVASGDSAQDKNRRAAFAVRAKKLMKVEVDPVDPKRATILVGEDAYPFPVPIVRLGGLWRFDPREGKAELPARRIGANEIDAIDLCAAYVEAQYASAAEDPEQSGVHRYAQRFISSPGKRDGLYWAAAPGVPASPIAGLVTEAAGEGYDVSVTTVPYHGYRFRILTRQGAQAPGGANDFLVPGPMIGGFGMIAWPAEHGASGIRTFIVNQAGIVYEKDLGPNTEAAAKALRLFKPDHSWKAVQ
jgi:hypothetical protein